MLLAALSAVVSTLCVAASARRLAYAVAPTPLDPQILSRAVARTERPWSAVRAAVSGDRSLAWEEATLAAGAETDPDARDAAIGEQLTEYEWLAGRWSRTPRVCASVATSAGFFFATLAVLQGMSAEDGGAVEQTAVLFRALDALAIGIAGTAFCAAVHVRARRAMSARCASLDALVDRMRAARASPPTSAPAAER